MQWRSKGYVAGWGCWVLRMSALDNTFFPLFLMVGNMIFFFSSWFFLGGGRGKLENIGCDSPTGPEITITSLYGGGCEQFAWPHWSTQPLLSARERFYETLTWLSSADWSINNVAATTIYPLWRENGPWLLCLLHQLWYTCSMVWLYPSYFFGFYTRQVFVFQTSIRPLLFNSLCPMVYHSNDR